MTVIDLEGIGGTVLFFIMSFLLIRLYGHQCRDAGYEEGRSDAYTEQLAEHQPRAGRHRASQPRTTPAIPPPAPPELDREPWYTTVSGPAQLPSGGAIGVYLGRTRPPVTDIDTVLLPPAPAPALNGADDTATIPRVHLDLASTGEMRALTSAWIAEHCPGAETETEAIA